MLWSDYTSESKCLILWVKMDATNNAGYMSKPWLQLHKSTIHPAVWYIHIHKVLEWHVIFEIHYKFELLLTHFPMAVYIAVFYIYFYTSPVVVFLMKNLCMLMHLSVTSDTVQHTEFKTNGIKMVLVMLLKDGSSRSFECTRLFVRFNAAQSIMYNVCHKAWEIFLYLS